MLVSVSDEIGMLMLGKKVIFQVLALVLVLKIIFPQSAIWQIAAVLGSLLVETLSLWKRPPVVHLCPPVYEWIEIP